MTMTRITSYYPDGRFTGCEHIIGKEEITMTMAERLEKKSEKVLDLLSELDDLYIWIEQELAVDPYRRRLLNITDEATTALNYLAVELKCADGYTEED